MKHIALIVTAESGSGARFVAPFLLPAIRGAASACCQDVRLVNEGEVERALQNAGDAVVLLLGARMPLVTEADCRALIGAAEKSGASVVAEGAPDGFPRCIYIGRSGTTHIALSEGALTVVDDPAALAEALKSIRRRTNEALMRDGVVLIDPERTYIDPDVRVGEGTVIHPGCTLTGGSLVGARCTLLPNNRVHASTVGDDTVIESSVLTECRVGSGTTVGPFAYLRPGAQVGDECRIGDFVEIKNSDVGDGTKISHLTYVGDSDLGKNINLGCGVVFVNYDGRHKHRTTVEDDAFIGCNVNLVSPVRVGAGAYVAAGSTVTEDVPAGALAVARERQVTKAGWVEKRKREGKL